jgi:hypothetical protein
MKRTICTIQDELFGAVHQLRSGHIWMHEACGVLDQLITVPTQLAGNLMACATGQRGAEASGEGGGMAPPYGRPQQVEPFSTGARTRRLVDRHQHRLRSRKIDLGQLLPQS